MLRTDLSTCRFRLLLPAILLAFAPAMGCQDVDHVDQRLRNSLRDLHMTNKKMEQHVREALLDATATSLEQPVLLIAHRGVFSRERGPATTLLIDEVIIDWMEATPSVDGVRLFSRVTDDKVDLYMTTDQIADVENEAIRYVVYATAFRMNSELRHTVQKLLKDGDVHAVLLSKGHPVSEPVPFKRWGGWTL